MNAVITHTVHFVSLLSFYLGIKLPFEVTWSSHKLGVGQPWIGAGKGTESGSWSRQAFSIIFLNTSRISSVLNRWHSKHPLHLSLKPTSPPSAPAALSLASRVGSAMSDSFVEHTEEDEPQTSFTTALAMLLYNVSYLAYTQGVEVPLSQTGDVLRNLWTVCCSVELGK
jgi:hypothetical protein